MRSVWPQSIRSHIARKPRGFTLAELMIVIVIIAVIMAIAAPSMTSMSRGLEVSKARSNVFASLTAARTRAITSHNLVALHVFQDNAAYAVGRDSSDPTKFTYNQCTAYSATPNFLRWGVHFDPVSGLPTCGLPHVPTNKTILRLEVPNPDANHNRNATNNAIEFYWPADHDPVILSDSLGICRANTPLDDQAAIEINNTRVNFAQDFYIVFAEDGRIATVLVDYNLGLNLTNTPLNTTSSTVFHSGGTTTNPGTWSASGLCLYDMEKFKSMQANPVNQRAYVNTNCLITLSPYTGLPLTEVSK